MSKLGQHFYEFGPFQLDPVKRIVLREGTPVPLTPKTFDTLLVLVQHRGQVLDKDGLMKTLWPDTVVEERNLTQAISTLRKALGESPNEHLYIVTIPGRGYQFVGNVKELVEEGAELVLEKHTQAHVVIEEEEEESRIEDRNDAGIEDRGSKMDTGSTGDPPSAIHRPRSPAAGGVGDGPFLRLDEEPIKADGNWCGGAIHRCAAVQSVERRWRRRIPGAGHGRYPHHQAQ
jgi:DNA-binding winged helix-turn-helix (wHTH) protein